MPPSSRDLIAEAVAKLPDPHAYVFALRFEHGILDFDVIAGLLNQRPGAEPVTEIQVERIYHEAIRLCLGELQ
jgi:hypothetical protein